MKLFLEEPVKTAIIEDGTKRFGTGKFGLVFFDPSCCGGVIQIEVRALEQLETITEIELHPPINPEVLGIPLYVDTTLIPDLAARVELLLKTSEPLALVYENYDFIH